MAGAGPQLAPALWLPAGANCIAPMQLWPRARRQFFQQQIGEDQMQFVLFGLGAACGAGAFYLLAWLMAVTAPPYWSKE